MRLTKAELDDGQSAMRDLQVSIADLHRASAGFHPNAEPLVTAVRSASAFVQKINDMLRTDFGQAAKYKRIFEHRLAAGDPDAELIEGFRYIRNVISHRLLRVSPDPTGVVGGAEIGYRTYAVWTSVPHRAHRRMHQPTQALGPHYRSHLLGRDVTETFLDVTRVFAELCPTLVHLNNRRDWTGFPLRSQPGVQSRLHPMEPDLDTFDPKSVARHQRWLGGRNPGGDYRAVCGRVQDDRGDWIVGFTFFGHQSFTPFVESPEQVTADVGRGYKYFAPSRLSLSLHSFGPYRGDYSLVAYVIDAPDLAASLGAPISDVDHIEIGFSVLSSEQWQQQLRLSTVDYLVRRSQRLAAVFPDW